jgi:lipoprotein-anchoring transpeptidase ErfK/SrfK
VFVDDYQLPVAWVYGGNKQATTYAIDEGANTIKPKGSVERFTAIPLTGETKKYRGTDYHQTKEDLWIKSRLLRVTEPGDLPEKLEPGETWVDVNISQQTLVAFKGETPIYATLVSTGKKSSIKEKDHSTPTGEWRVYVKHVTDTMDGDGTAAGDLPYSIEDVPYVMYFHRSYALHGAFWHRNYGVTMSHGCVNLAPLDAKHLFFLLGPHLPGGTHGVWSNQSTPGSIVKVHN